MRESEERALWAALVVLSVSTLLLASALRWTAGLSAALAFLAAVPLLSSRRSLGTSPLLWLLAVPVCATALQLLPLPSFLIKILSPGRWALAEANAQAYALPSPSVLCLSYDWPATLVELSKFSGYFAFGYLCLRLCHSRQAKRGLLRGVVWIALLVALCAIGHQIVGAKTIVGLYAPSIPEAQSLSPFLNPNHLAGYLAFACPLALAIAVERKSWLYGGVGLLLAGVSVHANSRGGLVALIVGLTLLGVVGTWQRKRNSRMRISPVWVIPILALAAIVLMVFLSGAGGELVQFDVGKESDAGKFLAWQQTPEMFKSSPWFGSGKGAFIYAFTQHQPAIGVTFSHIENLYLQSLLDWGLIPALLLAYSLFRWVKIISQRREWGWTEIGALASLSALAVHSAVDFHLELAGMAMPAIAVAAALSSVKMKKIPNKERARVRSFRGVAIVIGVLLAALSTSSLGSDANEDAARLKKAARSDSVLSLAKTMSKRHPAAFQVHAQSAMALAKSGRSESFQIMARALDLAPSHYAVHLLAAELLLRSQKPEQALVEYRRSLALPGSPMRKILDRVLDKFGEEKVLEAIPYQRPFDLKAAQFLLPKYPALSLKLVERGIADGALDLRYFSIGVQSAIRLGEKGRGLKLGELCDQRWQSMESALIYADSLLANNLPLIAEELLAERIPNSPEGAERRKGLALLVKTQIVLGEIEKAGKNAEELMDLSRGDKDSLKAAHQLMVTIEDKKGNTHQKQWHEKRVQELSSR